MVVRDREASNKNPQVFTSRFPVFRSASMRSLSRELPDFQMNTTDLRITEYGCCPDGRAPILALNPSKAFSDPADN